MIDLTCHHHRVNFATLDTAGRNYLVACNDCDWFNWRTPEWDGGTVEQALDIYEAQVRAEAAADNMNAPDAIAFAARYFLARVINTDKDRGRLAAGLWIAVHPTRFKATGTTSDACAETFIDARLYVIPPHVWTEAVDRLYAIWQADQKDTRR